MALLRRQETMTPPDEQGESTMEALEAVPAIGIDLGSSKWCVSRWEGGAARVMTLRDGQKTVPSCVSFDDFRHTLGKEALGQMESNPRNTLVDSKILLGKETGSWSPDPRWQYAIAEGIDGRPAVQVEHCRETKVFQPEEVYAMMLADIRRAAQAELGGGDLDSVPAVVSVPACFSQTQRQAVMDAAAIAGLDLLQLINEPTAAAVHYAVDSFASSTGRPEILVIFDMGGGYCDVSVVSVAGMLVEVRSSVGCQVGGRDVDRCLFDRLADDFIARYGSDPRESPEAVCRLVTAAQRAKKALTVAEETVIELEALHEGVDFFATITRAKLENLMIGELETCVSLARQQWAEASNTGLARKMLIVGGSCRIPKLLQMLSEVVGEDKVCLDLNLEEAVSQGAAAQAAVLMSSTDAPLDELMVFDVASKSVGLCTLGGAMTKIISKNTPIPTCVKSDFSTFFDSQPCLLVQIHEGEENLAEDNTLLEVFELGGIPLQEAGHPPVVSKFAIDSSGMLTLEVTDHSLGGINAILPLRTAKRLSEQQLLSMAAVEGAMQAKAEVWQHKTQARDKLLDLVSRVTEVARTESKALAEDREAVEIALEKAVAALAVFPLVEVEFYQRGAESLQEAAKCVLGSPDEAEASDTGKLDEDDALQESPMTSRDKETSKVAKE